jgi:acyl-CoA synthetase (AMP-forming)/AMP-acid ligase II
MQFDIRAPLLPDMVRLHGKWYPHKPAIIDEDKSLSWAEIDQRSNQVAHGLQALGIGTGDSVAILMTNVAEYVEIMFGIFKAGAVVVPLNLAVNEEGLLNMLQDASARAVFFTAEQYSRLAESLAAVVTLRSDGLLV